MSEILVHHPARMRQNSVIVALRKKGGRASQTSSGHPCDKKKQIAAALALLAMTKFMLVMLNDLTGKCLHSGHGWFLRHAAIYSALISLPMQSLFEKGARFHQTIDSPIARHIVLNGKYMTEIHYPKGPKEAIPIFIEA